MMSIDTDPAEPLPVAERGFNLGLPDGFHGLPIEVSDMAGADAATSFTGDIGGIFGLSADDENAQATAAVFAGLGLAAGRQGLDYAAIAYYLSPDDPTRPIMILLTGYVAPSDHSHPADAVANLRHGLAADAGISVHDLRLPIGPAVASVSEKQDQVVVGEYPFPVLTRQLTAWVPDPDGTAIGVVTVTTNSFQDWERVCTVGLDIFDTFEWEPLGAASS
ncbi:hypothetical protein [Haloechinothrix halophila]|uniref:hypothetical protein n=1 Tax=Haloechinothrix halophila TaxID=1069073 RepID=UPI000403AF72|nr:hypothetical protein [Haloechinothrix halophila]